MSSVTARAAANARATRGGPTPRRRSGPSSVMARERTANRARRARPLGTRMRSPVDARGAASSDDVPAGRARLEPRAVRPPPHPVGGAAARPSRSRSCRSRPPTTTPAPPRRRWPSPSSAAAPTCSRCASPPSSPVRSPGAPASPGPPAPSPSFSASTPCASRPSATPPRRRRSSVLSISRSGRRSSSSPPPATSSPGCGRPWATRRGRRRKAAPKKARSPRCVRRFAPRAAVLLVAFALCGPWIARSEALLDGRRLDGPRRRLRPHRRRAGRRRFRQRAGHEPRGFHRDPRVSGHRAHPALRRGRPHRSPRPGPGAPWPWPPRRRSSPPSPSPACSCWLFPPPSRLRPCSSSTASISSCWP